MANYTLEKKDRFNVLGLGTELLSDYTDSAGIAREKSEFWSAVAQDGRLDTLKAISTNDYIFAVNEAVNNKMMHYAGVITDESVSQESRVIEFPAGDYLVVRGEGSTAEELSHALTYAAFAEALPEVKDFIYVGGPNATVEMEQRDGRVVGEMWIPVVPA